MSATIAARSHGNATLSAPVRRAQKPRRKAAMISRLGRLALKRPGRTLTLLVFSAVAGAILANALFFQSARHPAPMISAPAAHPPPARRRAPGRAAGRARSAAGGHTGSVPAGKASGHRPGRARSHDPAAGSDCSEPSCRGSRARARPGSRRDARSQHPARSDRRSDQRRRYASARRNPRRFASRSGPQDRRELRPAASPLLPWPG